MTGPEYIKDQGNRAAHDSGKALTPQDAAATVRELFHACYWIARTYATGAKPNPAMFFDMGKLEKSLTISASTVAQIQKIESDFKTATKRAGEAEEAQKASEEGRNALEAELARLRAEVAEARKANQAVPDPHGNDETATRDAFCRPVADRGRLGTGSAPRP